MEANIDDQTPEQLAPVLDLLMDHGAYDAFFSPIQMKKNRPAVMLSVLINPNDQAQFTHLILKHTATVGIRYQQWDRTIMPRHFITVETIYGPVKVKVVEYGDIKKYSPEFVDCQAIAQAQDLALQQVYNAVYQQLK